jgi:hypothetical protein
MRATAELWFLNVCNVRNYGTDRELEVREVFAIGYNSVGGQNDGEENQEAHSNKHRTQYPTVGAELRHA